MHTKLQIVLSPIERSILTKIAEKEMRSLGDQVRYILVQELERLEEIPIPCNPDPLFSKEQAC